MAILIGFKVHPRSLTVFLYYTDKLIIFPSSQARSVFVIFKSTSYCFNHTSTCEINTSKLQLALNSVVRIPTRTVVINVLYTNIVLFFNQNLHNT